MEIKGERLENEKHTYKKCYEHTKLSGIFFANDLVLFARAIVANCQTISKILLYDINLFSLGAKG